MTTNYDTISHEYKKAKQQSWRTHIEQYSLFELIGDLAGKRVLDLACGEGYYTRPAKLRGAASVVGVDLSERMIALAKQQEADNPLGIEYQAGDARDVDLPEKCDLVIAGYLLNYARTKEELLQMCRAIVRNLKPGGRFVTVNSNPNHAPEYFPLTRKYGFLKSTPGELCDGVPVTWKFFLDDGDFEITNYHLSIVTHEETFKASGFHSITWHQPRLSPAGEAEFGRAHWTDLLKHPPMIFISCDK